MPIVHDNYDQLKIDRLKHYLDDMAAKGHPKPYEIFVDSLKVVPKTEDPKEFDNYEYYMNEDSEKIRLVIYNSNLSPRNDQYCFYVKQHKAEKGLNGPGDIDTIIQDKLNAKDREYELKQLQTELQQTRQKLEDADEYIEELESKLEIASNDKYKLKNLDLVELGSALLGRFAEKNADVLSGFGLTGLNNKEQKQVEASTEKTEASFQKKQGEGVTEEQMQYLSTLQQLQSRFSEQEMVSVIEILNLLMETPAQVPVVADFLRHKS